MLDERTYNVYDCFYYPLCPSLFFGSVRIKPMEVDRFRDRPTTRNAFAEPNIVGIDVDVRMVAVALPKQGSLE